MTRGNPPLYCSAPQGDRTGLGGAGQARLPTPDLRLEGPDAGVEGPDGGVEGPDTGVEARLVGVLGSRRRLTNGRAGLEGLLLGVCGLRRGPMASLEGPGPAAFRKSSGS